MVKEHIKKAIILFSGGLDSTTVMALAKNAGYDLYAMSFDYGQRHLFELEAAKKIALAYGVKAHLVVKTDLTSIGGSALTDAISVDTTGRPLLQANADSTQANGILTTIDGYPVRLNNELGDPSTASDVPAIFGNPKKSQYS